MDNTCDVGSLLEPLSAKVHEAWWEEKKSQGFHPPTEHKENANFNHVRDKFTKICDECHADMYPYDELPENIKDYDRVTVKAVLGALDSLGYSITK